MWVNGAFCPVGLKGQTAIMFSKVFFTVSEIHCSWEIGVSGCFLWFFYLMSTRMELEHGEKRSRKMKMSPGWSSEIGESWKWWSLERLRPWLLFPGEGVSLLFGGWQWVCLRMCSLALSRYELWSSCRLVGPAPNTRVTTKGNVWDCEWRNLTSRPRKPQRMLFRCRSNAGVCMLKHHQPEGSCS